MKSKYTVDMIAWTFRHGGHNYRVVKHSRPWRASGLWIEKSDVTGRKYWHPLAVKDQWLLELMADAVTRDGGEPEVDDE